jgi:hypothetical protein
MLSPLKLDDPQRVLPLQIEEAPPATADDPAPQIEDIPKANTPKKDWATRVILGAMLIMILLYLDTSALRFLKHVNQETYGIFWPRRGWLYAHVIAGILAILIGPVQFWPELKQKYPGFHRFMGIVYVAGAETGAVTAIYLAFHTDFGWMFSAGLGSMATAWIISTSLATVAICRRMIEQHREWMVRSYVLTLSFVWLRLTNTLLDAVEAGSIPDRFVFSSWMSWAVPLMITEAILQGRKVFAPRAK